jgi:putative RNA 2'-phosphotransferase
MRHGAPVIFRVDTVRLHADGQTFWQADNGVWLTHHVAPANLTLIG